MTILDAIRTLRKERDLPYHRALVMAVEHFKKTDREVPESIMSLYRREISR